MNIYNTNKNYMKTCERCGKESDDVYTTINPYIKEMSNEEIKITICDDCYSDLIMSV